MDTNAAERWITALTSGDRDLQGRVLGDPSVSRWQWQTLAHLDDATVVASGYTYIPYSSHESVIGKTKEQYCLALRQTQGTIRSKKPNWQPWIGYFLKALQSQKQRLETKIERERLMVDTLLGLSLQILELAREHAKLTNAQIVIMTGANRNTVKKHLQSLVLSNHLSQHGRGKGTWYARS